MPARLETLPYDCKMTLLFLSIRSNTASIRGIDVSHQMDVREPAEQDYRSKVAFEGACSQS